MLGGCVLDEDETLEGERAWRGEASNAPPSAAWPGPRPAMSLAEIVEDTGHDDSEQP
jgi:hypothetical protein